MILCFGKIKLGGSLQLTRCSVRVDMHSASGNQYIAVFLQPLHGHMLTEMVTRITCYRQCGYVPRKMFFKCTLNVNWQGIINTLPIAECIYGNKVNLVLDSWCFSSYVGHVKFCN